MRTQNHHDKGQWLVSRTVRWQLTRRSKDTQSKSYPLDKKEEMRTQSGHDKSEWLISRTVRHYKAIDLTRPSKDIQPKSYELDA